MINIPKTPIIYRILNKINNKVYIGSSINGYKRYREHFNYLKQNKHHSILLQRAWNKYGEAAFEFLVIEECQKEILIVREQYWMDYYDAVNPEKGYNINPKADSRLGTGGWHHTKEARQKISEAGHRPCSEETKEKISLAQKGKPRPPESVLKMKGQQVTPEHLERLRLMNLGVPSPKKGKHYIQFCPHGHDTFIEGRSKYGGGCNKCIRVYGKGKRNGGSSDGK